MPEAVGVSTAASVPPPKTIKRLIDPDIPTKLEIYAPAPDNGQGPDAESSPLEEPDQVIAGTITPGAAGRRAPPPALQCLWPCQCNVSSAQQQHARQN